MSTVFKITWIFLLFLALRIYFIFTFPPFIDESNWINFGERAITIPGLLFEPITIWYRQPLPFWLFGIGGLTFQFPEVGARLVNLLISIPAFFIVFELVKKLRNQETAIWALVFYSFCPLFIFFQSTVTIDSLLFPINLLLLKILEDKKTCSRWQSLVEIGLLLGLAFWIKNSAFFIIAITLITFLYSSRIKKIKTTLFALTLITSILIAVALPLILQNNFHRILDYNQFYALTLPEIFQFPLTVWLQNFVFLLVTLFVYLTPGVFLILIFAFKNFKTKGNTTLLNWFLISSLPLILSLRVTGEKNFFELRYFLFATAPLLPVLALSTDNILRRFIRYSFLLRVLILLPMFIGTFLVTFYPTVFFSFFPKKYLERDYAFGWSSGYGLKSSLEYFETMRNENSVILALLDDGGNNASAYLTAYYRRITNRLQIVYPSATIKDFSSLKKLAHTKQVFLISSNQRIPQEIVPFLKLIRVFEKPGNEDYIGLYKISY